MNLDAETLFTTYLLPLYPGDAPRDPAALAKTRLDDANPAKNPHLVAHLEDAAEVFARMAPELFGEDLRLDRTDASIHRLSAALTRERRDAWASRGTAGTPENQLFNVLVHGALYTASTVVRARASQATWLVRSPLWESRVHLKSNAGEGELAVLQWWLKSLSDDVLGSPVGLDLSARYRTHVEEPTKDWNALPVLFPTDRVLPRLSKVRYDILYKYIKAHLPELRDVGAGFPSPERFDELSFKWIEAKLVGGGRNVLLYGLGSEGLHVYWLGAEGFTKGLFYPAESFPEPVVRVKIPDGGNVPEKLEIIVSIGGVTTKHEMLWGGP